MRMAIVAMVGMTATGCVTNAATDQVEGPGAHATLTDANGRQTAVAEIGDEGGELYVAIDVDGMAPGRYAVHLHSVGRCDAPDFASAGPHWNPAGSSHGVDNANGPHLGDLPNVAINARGRGTVAFQIQGASLKSGPNPLLDADGASVVIHAQEDDLQTDPSGNSGARIACGVLGMSG